MGETRCGETRMGWSEFSETHRLQSNGLGPRAHTTRKLWKNLPHAVTKNAGVIKGSRIDSAFRVTSLLLTRSHS